MADFRLSAQIIKRSSGRSATAAAAYRAAELIRDERTGLKHDYTRKAGVVVSEIHAPVNTPEWMLDRSQLWNAVEATEKRKDAQVAREVQLSLPHELTASQRTELVRDYVKAAFVSQGMIADVCIHAPDRKSDERNHHAHILLTMRTLTADGFGNKAREWNAKPMIENWREQWANHQNHMLERHGHDARVDHRSYEKQGIDREATQHRGKAATDMMRKEKPNRIHTENQEREQRNAERALLYVRQAQVSAELAQARATLERDIEQTRAATTEKITETREYLKQRQEREHQELKHIHVLRDDEAKATLKAEVASIQKRIDKSAGFARLVRAVTGKTRNDQNSIVALNVTLRQIDETQAVEHDSMVKRHTKENDKLNKRNAEMRQEAERGIDQAKQQQVRTERREDESLRGSWTRHSEASNENQPRKRGDWGSPNRGSDGGRKPH